MCQFIFIPPLDIILQLKNDLCIFFQCYFDLNKDCLTTKWIISIWTLGQRLVLRGIWPTFFRWPCLLGSLFSEFTMEAKPHRSGLMAKAVAGKMPLRKFDLWGIAFPRDTGHSPFWVCPLDQSSPHPSLAPTNLSVYLPFSLFLMGFSAGSFTAP